MQILEGELGEAASQLEMLKVAHQVDPNNLVRCFI